ncbi:MAG: 3-phosphoshikimate 1-carboxyvinyltransferase, partial [Saprospiraceae bacterium]
IPQAQFFQTKKDAANDSGVLLRMNAGVSSQFLSALLLIGPYLPGGLTLIPEGRPVSRPYVDMTLCVMRHFGTVADWQPDGSIRVPPGRYLPRPLTIEADWSAASYWYAMAAFAEAPDLNLHGLLADSWQGDRVVAGMMQQFWGNSPVPFIHNFRDCPDVAQTFAVVCAGLGVPGEFSGLETLAIKETDRCAALATELAKVGVRFEPDAERRGVFRLSGKAVWQTPPRFATHGDHRMAMSLATLAMLGPVEIENPDVVAKSYPEFWEHLRAVGFVLEKTSEQ